MLRGSHVEGERYLGAFWRPLPDRVNRSRRRPCRMKAMQAVCRHIQRRRDLRGRDIAKTKTYGTGFNSRKLNLLALLEGGPGGRDYRQIFLAFPHFAWWWRRNTMQPVVDLRVAG